LEGIAVAQRAIWKFSLPVRAEPTAIPMPIGAEIVSVQPQRDHFCFWAIVDSSQDREERRFIWIATGQTFNADAMRYHGTVQTANGVRVFHLFEVIAS
jgi:hypothetical protein